MRSIVCLLLSVVCLAGCVSSKSEVNAGKKPGDKIIVTQETALTGAVVRVNESTRFAVLNFPVGSLPGVGQHLNVYRQGAKVGEVRITGPQLNDNIIADISNGSVQVGDEIRGN